MYVLISSGIESDEIASIHITTIKTRNYVCKLERSYARNPKDTKQVTGDRLSASDTESNYIFVNNLKTGKSDKKTREVTEDEN